jgi:hypothetical protein
VSDRNMEPEVKGLMIIRESGGENFNTDHCCDYSILIEFLPKFKIYNRSWVK